MKIVLDECIPRKLKAIFIGHDVKTVPEAGWAGKKNGELLALLEGKCDFFVTVDANLLHQQPAKARPFGIAVIARTRTTEAAFSFVYAAPSFR